MDLTATLGRYDEQARATAARLTKNRIAERIWNRDHTVWRPQPEEIANRLGWLDAPDRMRAETSGLERIVTSLRDRGLDRTVLCGMGGSSLAPEVYRKVYGVCPGLLDLSVLDTTDPDAILAVADRFEPARTLVIVSTKSGSTVETLSLLKFFWRRSVAALGETDAAKRFAAITDPGSSLEVLARRLSFAHVALADPNVGGRYSALTHFGLLPAALVGVDLAALLDHAAATACECGSPGAAAGRDNPGVLLGAWLGSLALAGRDKLTLVPSEPIAPFGVWLEQLVAESLGKDGKGILPVEGEPLGAPSAYGEDRVFVNMRLEGDDRHDAALGALRQAGHPVVRIPLRGTLDLGGQIFLWEMATAVAGHVLGVQPFDQPNVEAAKVLARRQLSAYSETGKLPQAAPAFSRDGIAVFGETGASDAAAALREFVSSAHPGDYLALQAYVEPSERADAALGRIRLRARDGRRVATTAGYGPRFLHSTGQLHKGDGGRGLFVQITADDARDAPIPDGPEGDASSMSFGTLKMAQALGDAEALRQAGRRVLRFHVGADLGGLDRLAEP